MSQQILKTLSLHQFKKKNLGGQTTAAMVYFQ
jgi:hypothetical protein